ncbi:hypothetical protein [Desemzia sp. FAM 23991]|uniref:hypothetical protein n=1 Tax=unclassified Desemzia TaxID=2685243 RepID=UPI00388A1959
MKKFKKIFLSIGILALICIVFIFIWNILDEDIHNPNNSYRQSGTSMTAHQIRIDDYYAVESMSYYYSILRYDNHDGDYIDYTDSLHMVNWDENYIVASCRVDQLSSDSEFYYLIVERDTQDVSRFDSISAFEEAMNEKNIDLELKERQEFDWYL